MKKTHSFDYHKEVLIFTHIPKCGGTSIHDWLATTFNGKYIHFSSEPYEHLDLNIFHGGGGHQSFGENPLCQVDKEARHITVIREPISRFFSFYNHISEHPDHHLHQLLLKTNSHLDFAKACYDNGNFEISNLQTKMISGKEHPCWEEAIDSVRKNYCLLGFQDDLSGFFKDLSEFLGCHNHPFKKLNVTPPKTLPKDKLLINFIKEINKEDITLYNTLFAER